MKKDTLESLAREETAARSAYDDLWDAVVAYVAIVDPARFCAARDAIMKPAEATYNAKSRDIQARRDALETK